MRFRGMRLLGGMTLSLLIGLSMPACSGSQQQGSDEEMEVSDEQGNQANESENANGEAEEGNNEETNNTANEGEATEGEETAENGEETAEVAEGGNATENDLQEIIQEMNGQPAEGTADAAPANAQPLMQEAIPAAAVADSAPAAQTAASAVETAAVSSTTAPFQPGGSPAAAGLPEIGSKMAYIVQAGDTLAKISGKIYGNVNRWKEMASLSGLNNPSKIYPGDVVYYTLDEGAIPFATAYESIQRSEETVKAGDTLATIAQRVYGNSKSWKAIWRQNDNINNPDVVTPGSTVYYIQSGALSAAVVKVKAQLAQAGKVFPVSKAVSKNLKTLSQSGKKLAHANSVLLAGGHSNMSVVSVANLN